MVTFLVTTVTGKIEVGSNGRKLALSVGEGWPVELGLFRCDINVGDQGKETEITETLFGSSPSLYQTHTSYEILTKFTEGVQVLISLEKRNLFHSISQLPPFYPWMQVFKCLPGYNSKYQTVDTTYSWAIWRVEQEMKSLGSSCHCLTENWGELH